MAFGFAYNRVSSSGGSGSTVVPGRTQTILGADQPSGFTVTLPTGLNANTISVNYQNTYLLQTHEWTYNSGTGALNILGSFLAGEIFQTTWLSIT